MIEFDDEQDKVENLNNELGSLGLVISLRQTERRHRQSSPFACGTWFKAGSGLCPHE